ncbi:MAG: potassium transporter KefB [Alphaproteobacteria bacterium]|nr:MAG: potassium transporter KefB [Alphaproteobacteria bacterium]
MTAVETLQPAIIYLGAGLAAALASRAVRLSPIVGYLVAGVVIGPSGFGLVQNNETSRFLADLGVVFLLFDIGLHFSLREISTRRDDMIGLAPLQIILCGGAFASIGVAFGFPWPVAALVGVSLALSSTAVVARILSDRNQPGCPMGRSATAVLVAQDIVAIFLLTFAASLGGDPNMLGMEALIVLGKAVLALAFAILAGRFVVRPLFESLAATGNRETFTVVALFIVLAASAATARADLSLTLGAFLAGMAVSDTAYRHVVQNEVKPFAGLLLGLFFMSVGMGVNLPAMAAIWPAVLLTALVIVILKTVVVFAAARLNGWALPGATQLGFLLSQGSEFTLVVVGIASISGAMPGNWAGVITAAVAVTLVAAPIWTSLGLHIAKMLAENARTIATDAADAAEEEHVLIFGMTPEARLAADALRDHQIPYVAVEADPERFVSAASDGYTIVFGEAKDARLMESVGATRVRAIVLGASGFTAPQTATTADGKPPPRFVAVTTGAERVRQAGMGHRSHLAHAEPRGVELVTDLLTELGVEQKAIAAWIAGELERRGLIDKKHEEDEPEVA